MPLPTIVLSKDSTLSTMDDARSALRAGYGHGTVCIARTQSAGRGRIAGRQWEDNGAGDLLFTLIVDKSCYTAAFPPTQALALALCRHLERRYGLSPSIKWPNDVLISGAKIAGILVESTGNFFLAGIGVNLVLRKYPDNLRRPAVSIAAALERFGNTKGALSGPVGAPLPSPKEELLRLLEEIDAVLRMPPSIEDIMARLEGLGRPVKVRLGDPSKSDILQGVLSGLGSDGSLLIKTTDGRNVSIYSGEVEVG